VATAPMPAFHTKPAGVPPVVNFITDPGQPSGANGWFTGADGVGLKIQAQPSDSAVYYSVGHNPFRVWSQDLRLANDTYDVRFFAVKPDGTASDVQTVRLQHDASPPPTPDIYFFASLRTLTWVLAQ